MELERRRRGTDEAGEMGEISYGCGCDGLGRFACLASDGDRTICVVEGKVKGEAEVGVGVREEESEGGGGRNR